MAYNTSNVNDKWWTSETLAVVTGANKGVGFEIARQLAENGLTVILTARDVNRGLTATKALHEKGLHNVVFRRLDIQSPDSVSEFTTWLKDTYGGLDILVNNAAILGAVVNVEATRNLGVENTFDRYENPRYKDVGQTNYEMTKTCFEINYYGSKRITEALLPLFKSSTAGARIVNVSSEAGLLEFLRNDSLRQEVSDVSNLTEEFIDKMVIENFLEDVKSGDIEGKGWPFFFPQYCVSKMAFNAYSRLLNQRLSGSEEERKIYVNSVHPGIVKTDMTHFKGEITAAEAAESSVMLALFPPGGPSGQFYHMKKLHHF